MSNVSTNAQSSLPEPRGFSEHTRRTSGENAHEQGWGLNEDERRQIPADQQRRGGTDFECGAQDFGDVPADTSTAQAAAGTPAQPAQSGSPNVAGDADPQQPARRRTA